MGREKRQVRRLSKLKGFLDGLNTSLCTVTQSERTCTDLCPNGPGVHRFSPEIWGFHDVSCSLAISWYASTSLEGLTVKDIRANL